MVIEMVKAGSDALLDVITDLISLTIKEEQIPDDRDQSSIINFFKGTGDATMCGNYWGLKLLEKTMKLLERIADVIIRQHVDIDSILFGFISGCSNTDAVFVPRQM